MKINFPKIEEKILKFWQKNKIFEKSIEQRQKAPNFVFYEGPPTANAKPGLHHVLARVFKDIVCRYKTMRGFKVLRKAGWDTHGLPVELEIEKKSGLKNKKDIEKYGLAKFNKRCKESVWQYKKDWEKLTERIAFWLDINHPYITYENNYIETLWWIIKQIHQKGLLYKDYKVVPYCPRCGTSLSSHEVALGYKKIKEPAIYIKFKIQNSKFKNCYLLVWTTTPWTLPGNVAIAVNPDFTYAKVKIGNKYLILAKERLATLGVKDKITEEIKGKTLVGLEYESLFSSQPGQVIAADFVSLEEGTGLVHIAPAFGEEDLTVWRQQFPKPVDEEGKMITPGYRWDKLFVKDADPLIIEDLRQRELLFKEELYEHDYPFCWRCDSPLLYYAKESWFINMQRVKRDLLKNNQKINWIPGHLKEGRFGEWLKELKDWALSRERYWGTPLPIWACAQIGKNQKSKIKNQKSCNNIKVIGSIQELEKLSKKKPKDLHRPYIDEITFQCEKCGREMKRTPEVIDCWFDSGAMPFAQNQKSKIKNQKLQPPKLFPADYISEGIDQTRGWFYTLLAVSTLLEFGPSYKNVISLGHVLDEKGEKMSKSKGNVVDPWYIVEKYSADATRWYFFTVNQPGEAKLFSEKGVEQAQKRFIMTLWNSYLFFETYAPKKKSKIKNQKSKIQIKNKKILDRWIVSRLNGLIQQTEESLNKYDITSAARTIENFVIEDFSQWYIRRSRKRFQKPETKEELREASAILNYILLTLSKLTAPFIPFLSEEIYQSLCLRPSSVHLCDYPKLNKKLIDKKLEKKMEEVREIVTLALAERAKAKIKVRQPIASLKIKNQKSKIKNKELLNLIKDEINVKEVVFDSKIKNEIELDTKITPELKEEGMVREVIRQIQEMRKELGLKPKDKISVRFSTGDNLSRILTKNKNFILKEAKVINFILEEKTKKTFDAKKEIIFEGQNLWLAIKKQ